MYYIIWIAIAGILCIPALKITTLLLDNTLIISWLNSSIKLIDYFIGSTMTNILLVITSLLIAMKIVRFILSWLAETDRWTK